MYLKSWFVLSILIFSTPSWSQETAKNYDGCKLASEVINPSLKYRESKLGLNYYELAESAFYYKDLPKPSLEYASTDYVARIFSHAEDEFIPNFIERADNNQKDVKKAETLALKFWKGSLDTLMAGAWSGFHAKLLCKNSPKLMERLVRIKHTCDIQGYGLMKSYGSLFLSAGLAGKDRCEDF